MRWPSLVLCCLVSVSLVAFPHPLAATAADTAARANSYDQAWRDGADGWVARAKAILSGGNQVPGLVLWLGDSLTRDPALGAWAQRGAGKTASDTAITNWMHAGLSPQGIDSIDGFALATPYICSARSYTVGDGMGAWDFMGTSGMPALTDPSLARQTLQDCSRYNNGLDLTTILSAIPKAQFAIPLVNLLGTNPADLTNFTQMLNLLIANHIVPIISTYTYRDIPSFNLLVDQYNVALKQLAQTMKLPLMDLNAEMLARVPYQDWGVRYLSDGVHYTNGGGGYTSTSDPYADGGDPATHATGAALTYNGYGLRGWLAVQKMKQIKALVIGGGTPPAAPRNVRIVR